MMKTIYLAPMSIYAFYSRWRPGRQSRQLFWKTGNQFRRNLLMVTELLSSQNQRRLDAMVSFLESNLGDLEIPRRAIYIEHQKIWEEKIQKITNGF